MAAGVHFVDWTKQQLKLTDQKFPTPSQRSWLEEPASPSSHYFTIRGGSRKKIAKKMIPKVPTRRNV
jgi:hypothetical protein